MEEADEMCPGPSQRQESQSESGREGRRIVVHGEALDEEGGVEVDIESEAEQEEDQGQGHEDVVNVDQEFPVEIVEDGEFSSNRSTWLLFRRHSILRS